MAADDLSAPLGQKPPASQGRNWAAVARYGAVAVLGGTLAGFVGWAAFVSDPLGGEPVVIVAAEHAPASAEAGEAETKSAGRRHDGSAPEQAAKAAAVSATPASATPANGQTINIIDGTSGERTQVVLPGPATPAPAGKTPGAKSASGADPRLIETTRHGPVPKIGEDGARPADIYASPATAALARPDAPRIAIVVAGLGIGAKMTADAISGLPAAVTLAVAPHGTNLDATIRRARAAGHEILLQVPMEPFDYPDNDPGPQTLLAGLGPEENIDRLQWLMSRFQGYVGITNQKGARFTASEPALGPIMHEAGRRGLIYVDDGSSPRSVAGDIAGANHLPFGKTDVVLDAVPTPGEIDQSLARLEALARENGVAVGYAHAVPVSIEHIAKWAKAAERRGFALVPISNAAGKAKSS